MNAHGPFNDEQEARAAAHAIIKPDTGWSILSEAQNRRLLERACEVAGVDPGAYGTRILRWLAGFEDATCEAIADLIIRAHEAGQRSAPPKVAARKSRPSLRATGPEEEH